MRNMKLHSPITLWLCFVAILILPLMVFRAKCEPATSLPWSQDWRSMRCEASLANLSAEFRTVRITNRAHQLLAEEVMPPYSTALIPISSREVTITPQQDYA